MKGFMGRQSSERVCRDATSGLAAGTHAAAGVALSPDFIRRAQFCVDDGDAAAPSTATDKK